LRNQPASGAGIAARTVAAASTRSGHRSAGPSAVCGSADPNFPEEFKPERSKLVFVLEANMVRVVAHCDPGRPLAWTEAENHRLLRNMAIVSAQTGRQVLVAVRDRYTAILPDRPLGAIGPGQRVVYREMRDGSATRIEPIVE
jgi:hypothetical protein